MGWENPGWGAYNGGPCWGPPRCGPSAHLKADGEGRSGTHRAEGQSKPPGRGSEGRCIGRPHRLCPQAGGGEVRGHVVARWRAGPEHVQLRQAPGREPQRRGCEPGGEEGP